MTLSSRKVVFDKERIMSRVHFELLITHAFANRVAERSTEIFKLATYIFEQTFQAARFSVYQKTICDKTVIFCFCLFVILSA